MELQLGQLARTADDIGYLTGLSGLNAPPGRFSIYTTKGESRNLNLALLDPTALDPIEVLKALRIVRAMPLASTQELYQLQNEAMSLKTICPDL